MVQCTKLMQVFIYHVIGILLPTDTETPKYLGICSDLAQVIYKVDNSIHRIKFITILCTSSVVCFVKAYMYIHRIRIYRVDSIIQPSLKNLGLTDAITDEVISSMGKINPLVSTGLYHVHVMLCFCSPISA